MTLRATSESSLTLYLGFNEKWVNIKKLFSFVCHWKEVGTLFEGGITNNSYYFNFLADSYL